MSERDRSERYPVIKASLIPMLMGIEPSVHRAGGDVCEYRPARVKLRSGRVLDRVYVVEAGQYIRRWGVWPEDDQGKSSVAIDEVVSIEESPYRLPAALANKIYESGESGMGYVVFTVVLEDGRELPFVTGNAVDFPQLPQGITTKEVVDVLPHTGRGQFSSRPPGRDEMDADYFWCLYRGG